MANLESYAQVDVRLAEHQYPVIICRNGLNDSKLLMRFVASKQVLIVTNETVAPLYLERVRNCFSTIKCDVVVLPDGEEHKNQHSLFMIYDALIQNKHHRDTTLIALGGGVVGDITGFAASTYQRGVNLIHIPTTLLAQVDASVGGKTAINHPQAKNMIGSFYQPKVVLIDLQTLHSLPDREFKAGLAEVIKYGLLAGGDFLKTLNRALKQGLTAQSPDLALLIEQCCQIKARYVEGDEKEFGARALLNLGHTFAHALEAYTQYRQWLHGEAVAIGLYCAAVLSAKLKLNDGLLVEQVKQMLEFAGLPHQIPASINLKQLMDLMRLDKKIKEDCLRFVVIKTPGDCLLYDGVTQTCLVDTLTMVAEGESR